ncbi:MAG: multidrug DMT transporter permease [Thermogutta sp.]|nr:multidrug DMT transporter permease [Thermogutta sp.]
MFVLESYPAAVVFCIITMLCWGSWANTQKLAGRSWRFELFYWDYVIGVLLTALILAFTMGSMGDKGRPFLEDLAQAQWPAQGWALLGGVVFNAANILLVAAIALAGMAVAFPVGIGLALIVGMIVNYINQPTGDPILLFSGMTLVAVAIVLDALAYRRLPSQKESGGGAKGLILSILCGLLMGTFYLCVARSMAEDPIALEPGKLSPYTAMVFFSLGVLLSNFVFNTLLMRFPVAGQPVAFADYFRGSPRDHLWGIVGGMIWGVGMTMSIIAAGKAGFAISYGLGQGATLVAALWGVFVWREFREAPPGTSRLLAAMFAAFLVGLTTIILSR